MEQAARSSQRKDFLSCLILSIGALLSLHSAHRVQALALAEDIPDDKRRAIAEILKLLPSSCTKYIQSISLKSGQSAGGMTDVDRSMWIAAEASIDQLRAIVVHECAHAADFWQLQGDPRSGRSPFRNGPALTFNDDPSIGFYAMSWQSNAEKKRPARAADFVSRYAMQSAYEDFAETFAYAVLHRTSFEQRMKDSRVLQRKFAWMQRTFHSALPSLGQQLATETLPMPDAVTNLPYAWPDKSQVSQVSMDSLAPSSSADSFRSAVQ